MSDVDVRRRGLIIIQIDGLSHDRMIDAMARRQLPFLRKLVRQKKYVPFRYLSEVPTSTPAFQGGMFYGSNENIPGFCFYDKRAQRLYRMGLADAAHSVEGEMKNPGLARGGSVLSCVFTGGAAETMFVFSNLLAPSRWRFVLSAWDIVLLTALNLVFIMKLAGLILLELALAVYDAIKWILRKGWIGREITIIGIRLGLTIFTRELITVAAVLDMYRRLPVIYLNFLGYDEQAHLRGPDSPVARWTLLGIDRSIRRIFKAKLRAEREYDLYVLSDHGQCATLPFEVLEDGTLAEFLEARLTGLMIDQYAFRDKPTAQLVRTVDGLHQFAQATPRLFRPLLRLYTNYLQKRLNQQTVTPGGAEAFLDVSVVSSGPVAYIYWNRIPNPLTDEELEEMHPGLIDELAGHPAIGCVSVRTSAGDVLIRAKHGYAVVGADKCRVSGNLPFSDSEHRDFVMQGIRRVTLFQRAGDLCVWGGNSSKGCVSYSFEFGAHSGWTDDEITAFVLAPVGIDFDFSTIRRHSEFYDFFSSRYGQAATAEPVRVPESAPMAPVQ